MSEPKFKVGDRVRTEGTFTEGTVESVDFIPLYQVRFNDIGRALLTYYEDGLQSAELTRLEIIKRTLKQALLHAQETELIDLAHDLDKALG